MLNVLQVHNRPLIPGGADQVVANEAEMLRAEGCRVEQLIMDTRSELSVGEARTAAKVIWNRAAQHLLEESMASIRPDVVHVHTPFPLMSPAIFRTAHQRGVPTVGTSHSYRYSCIRATCYRDGDVCELCVGARTKAPGVRYRCYKDSYLASLAMASSLAIHRLVGTFHDCVTRYIALSGFMKDLYVRDGFPRNKIVVKPNSVPDPGLRGDRRSDYVLYAGRLTIEKGIPTLIEAWERSPQLPRLIVAGDGDLRATVLQAAAQDPRIEYRGWVTGEHMRRLLDEALGLLLPSEWYEGHPLVAVEALARGVPVISSKTANSSGVVEDRVSGALFETGDPASLSDKILEMTRDRQELEDMGRAARARYRSVYSQEDDVARLLEIYRSIL